MSRAASVESNVVVEILPPSQAKHFESIFYFGLICKGWAHWLWTGWSITWIFPDSLGDWSAGYGMFSCTCSRPPSRPLTDSHSFTPADVGCPDMWALHITAADWQKADHISPQEPRAVNNCEWTLFNPTPPSISRSCYVCLPQKKRTIIRTALRGNSLDCIALAVRLREMVSFQLQRTYYCYYKRFHNDS